MRVSRGTVYLRGGTWTINITVNGRRYREAVGGNRRLAEMTLQKRAAEALEGSLFKCRNQGRMSFSEFARLYLERVTSMQKSAISERNRVLSWARHFGARPLGSITRVEIGDWQCQKARQAKPATVNRILCRLRHMLNKAVEWELLDETPMKRLRFLPENNARMSFLRLEECERLIASCAQERLRAIIILALHTGMRRGEILSLGWEDVDFERRFISIHDSKNGQPRHVPLDSTVCDLLASYPRYDASLLIFPGEGGKRLTTFQYVFKRAREAAGLPDLHFHDLRHTFASQWMMAGGDLYVLKEILGHKTVQMTQRYAHLSPEFMKGMVDRMERIWTAGRTSDGQGSNVLTMPAPAINS